MIDFEEAAVDYAKSFADKSRIYFIEKYLYTFDATKGKKVPFHVFPRQRVFLETLATNRNVVSIKPRQCGITTLTSAWATAQCAFAEEGAPETILCIGNKLDLAQQLITKIHEFLNQVPRWFWGEDFYSPDPKSEKNSKSIFVKDSKSELELFNGCRIVARSSGENAARGISAVSILILDEAAFIENGVAVYATAAATMASNPNSRTVMVSTPNGKDMLYYNTYRLALAKENNFIAVQFRWYQDPRYNKHLKWFKKNKNSGELDWIIEPILDKTGTVKYDEKHWEELVQKGWTPRSPWYEEMCKSFNNDKVKIAQELDVSFVGSSDNVIDPEYIDMQEKLNVRGPLEEMKDSLVEETWFWKPPIAGHRYICSCLPTGEQVLTQRGLVNVEDVKADDLLVTKEGEFTGIKHRMYRDVEDEEVVEILPYGCVSSFKFTHNHPIWASNENKNVSSSVKINGEFKTRAKWKHNFGFINASEIVENETWLNFPNIYAFKTLSDEEILEHWKPYEIDFHNQYTGLFDNPLLNTDFWWYCGMWLAEGCIRNTNSGDLLITYHNINETEYHDKIINNIAKEIFNRSAKLDHREHMGNGCNVNFKCKEAAKFIHDTFGKHSYGKHISEWVKYLPGRLKMALLRGYFEGDGSRVGKTITAVSVSLKLLEDIQDILFSCGIVSTIANSRKKGIIHLKDRDINNRDSYYLRISSSYVPIYMEKVGKECWFSPSERKSRKCIYFCEDGSINIKVRKVNRMNYTGKVYNFETESDSHTFCGSRISEHNCDPSRGSSDDNTAIEIIDMDARDENGMPIVEQVAEYYGKKLGDDIGELVYNYATLYNNAYVVIDCTNGLGDVPLFTLIHKGYKNLYYDDSELKKYTVQQTSKPYKLDNIDVMPGFHMQGNRYPVLSNFANMVRNNEFKIRSIRVINELNTWIFKGEAKRMDHMDGSHDDAITCLAMGLFVMLFSYKKMEKAQDKDKAILSAYMMSGAMQVNKNHNINNAPITPNNGLPFYNNASLNKYRNARGEGIQGTYMWLFGGTY